MAEKSPRDTNFIEHIRNADGYDDYTESAIARLAARYEASARIEQITRTTSPLKEPKGWRDQLMRILSTRRQSQLRRRERRSHVKAKVAPEELISASKVPIPCLRLGNSCSKLGGYKVAPAINCVPRLLCLSTIKEHVDTNRRSYGVHAASRSSRAAKEKLKQKKLRNGGSNFRKQQPGSKRSSPKQKREIMMVYQSDPALCHFLGGQNEINPTCRPSILERLVLKGELLLSSLLRPNPAAENMGFQDPHINTHENAGGSPKGILINFNFAVTTAFNVPITGLMFPPLERRVRVCLFDGCNFLGNIHVFSAVTAIEEEDEPWVFVNKGASRCLVQYSSREELSLYIEVNVRYKSVAVFKVPVWLSKGAENEHGETNEITCAWAMLDLPNNATDLEEMLSRSSSELPLLVGSMECPVDVNSVHMPSGRSRVVAKKGGELSAIHLHWYKLSDFQKKYSRLLPETILASNEEVPFLVLYRKTLLDALLNESSLLPDDAVFSPLIQLYPWMLNERGKQVQQAFKESWIARKLEWPPNTDCMKNKNRQKYLKGFNNSLLLIWPLLQSHNVRQPTWPGHSAFEADKFEGTLDNSIRKQPENEIGKSPVHTDSSADTDCSSSSTQSELSGTHSRGE